MKEVNCSHKELPSVQFPWTSRAVLAPSLWCLSPQCHSFGSLSGLNQKKTIKYIKQWLILIGALYYKASLHLKQNLLTQSCEKSRENITKSALSRKWCAHTRPPLLLKQVVENIGLWLHVRPASREEEIKLKRNQVTKYEQCQPTERGRGWRYAKTRLAGNKKWISEGLTPPNTDLSLFSTVLCYLTLSPSLYLNPLSAAAGGPADRKWRGCFTYLKTGLLELSRAHKQDWVWSGDAEFLCEVWWKNMGEGEMAKSFILKVSPHLLGFRRYGSDCSVMGDETTHAQDKCVDFPKSREGYIILFECLLIGQQSAKHPSIHQVTL